MSADRRRRIPVQDLGDDALIDRVWSEMKRRLPPEARLMAELSAELGVHAGTLQLVLDGRQQLSVPLRRLLECWVGRT